MDPGLNAPRAPSADEVALWLCDLTRPVPTTLRAAWRELLSPDERVAVERFRAEADREQHLAARALVRGALSRHAQVPPEAWRFERGPGGRPEVVAPRGAPALRFSLAHSARLAVCAVTLEHEVGVDAEDLERDVDPLVLAERFFAPDEAAALRRAPARERRRLFLAHWTLKEAYGKARGHGLSPGLRRFAFEVRRGAPLGLRLDPELGDSPARWRLFLLEPDERHVVAVAVRARGGDPLRLTLRRTLPLVEERPASARLVGSTASPYEPEPARS